MKTLQVVAALIWRDGKFLACQRPAGKARAMQWEFLGGKVEPGETKEQALIRECTEELGITVTVEEAFARVSHDYPDVQVDLTVYCCSIARGEPAALEHNQICWVTPEQARKLDFCPADRIILNKLLK